MDAPVDELSAVVNLDVVGGDRRDVAVLEVDEPVGVFEHGGDVGADHVLAVAEADDDGAAAAGGDDGVLALEEDGDGVGALHAGEGLGDAVDGAAGLLEEVGEDLGVGLGAEAMASATELLSEGVVVLDAAVVDDGDAAGAVEVGVRVELGGSADGGPAGVADADGAGDGARGSAEVLDEADGLGDADAARARARVAVEDGDAAGIVAAVLDAVERVEEDGQRVSGPDVPRDSAHRQLLGGVLRATQGTIE